MGGELLSQGAERPEGETHALTNAVAGRARTIGPTRLRFLGRETGRLSIMSSLHRAGTAHCSAARMAGGAPPTSLMVDQMRASLFRRCAIAGFLGGPVMVLSLGLGMR